MSTHKTEEITKKIYSDHVGKADERGSRNGLNFIFFVKYILDARAFVFKPMKVSFYTQMRKRCINKNDFSDITFLIGPKREPIHAHRAMLAARSEVFRTVLKQQLVNGNNKQGRDNAGFGFGSLTSSVQIWKQGPWTMDHYSLLVKQSVDDSEPPTEFILE